MSHADVRVRKQSVAYIDCETDVDAAIVAAIDAAEVGCSAMCISLDPTSFCGRLEDYEKTEHSAEQPVAASATNSAGQPVTGSSHRTTEPAIEHSHAPQASATAAEHGSERWETAPAAADKWQVKFPSGW